MNLASYPCLTSKQASAGDALAKAAHARCWVKGKSGRSKPAWVGFREFAFIPFRGAIHRFDRAGVVVMENDIELVREVSEEVVAVSLAFRQINNSNGALEFAGIQWTVQLRMFIKAQEKI